MPPLFSASVGVPPATVIASLMLTVRVTTWPAWRSPLPLPSIPCQELVADVNADSFPTRRSSDLGLVTAPDRLALLLAASCSVAPFRLNDVTARSPVSCPAPTVYLKHNAAVPLPLV